MLIDRDKLGKKPPVSAGDYLTEMFSPSHNAVAELPLDQLVPWQGEQGERQPFHMYPPEKLKELAENIAQYGIHTPIFVRPLGSGYQILAGHNRVAAARLAGLTTAPAVVRAVDDDTAKLILTDTNLFQREKLLPSEKAFAYKMRLDALKRQGQRTDLTSGQVVQKLSIEVVGEQTGENYKQVQRYIRLTYLTDAFLALMDADKLPFTVGVFLSYLTEPQQTLLLELMARHHIGKISRSQAEELKDFRDTLDEPTILRIFGKVPTAPVKGKTLAFKVPADWLPAKAKAICYDEELLRRISAVVEEYMGGLTE